MKSISIKGSKRESVGKKDSKALRNAEKIPCVLYGGKEVIHFSVDEMSLKPLIYTPDVYTVSLDLGSDGVFNAIKQDVQFHPVSDAILHIDFYQLHDDKPITLSIPVKLNGSPAGVRAGGLLKITNNRLSVTALPKNLPDVITIDIEKLKIGERVTVKDIRVEEYKINQPDNIVICQVRMARGAAVAVATEDADEDDE
jgi:large subunit ribosomal protein L25